MYLLPQTSHFYHGACVTESNSAELRWKTQTVVRFYIRGATSKGCCSAHQGAPLCHALSVSEQTIVVVALCDMERVCVRSCTALVLCSVPRGWDGVKRCGRDCVSTSFSRATAVHSESRKAEVRRFVRVDTTSLSASQCTLCPSVRAVPRCVANARAGPYISLGGSHRQNERCAARRRHAIHWCAACLPREPNPIALPAATPAQPHSAHTAQIARQGRATRGSDGTIPCRKCTNQPASSVRGGNRHAAARAAAQCGASDRHERRSRAYACNRASRNAATDCRFRALHARRTNRSPPHLTSHPSRTLHTR